MKSDLKLKILSMVKKDLSAIETALLENLSPNLDLAKEIAGHLLFSGGKRFRPLLFILSARLCGYNSGFEIKFSTIFEFLHAATLLHDDVVDGADLRRGRVTAHAKWSAPQVVLTGDFLLARSLSIASQTKKTGIIDVIATITEEMSQGEIDQLAKKGNLTLTENEYMDLIRRKTAVLIQGACRSGAIIAESPKAKENALADYGYHLGLAFQMADDLLDYTSDAKALGKNPGADIREGKLTLPLIKALSMADKTDRTWMEAVIKNPVFNEKEFKTLVEKLHQNNGIAYTESKASYHVKQAKQSLNLFDDSETKEVMLMLADYALGREV